MQRSSLVAMLMAVVLITPTWARAELEGYVAGVFGAPDSLETLRAAGLNAVVVRTDELPAVANQRIQKIYNLAMHAFELRRGVRSDKLEERIAEFRRAGAPAAYYAADDVKCSHADEVRELKRRVGVSRAMVGVIQGVQCYPDDDLLAYRYPLMRRKMSLAEDLKHHIARNRTVQAGGKRKAYLAVQTHPQRWYKDVVQQSNATPSALLYPDGQVVRMTMYYAMAAGPGGYILYNHHALTGDDSRERVAAVAQTLIETRGLFPLLADVQRVDFLQRGGIHGSVVRTARRDVIFLFSGDERALYHPAARGVGVRIADVVERGRYRALQRLTPNGLVPAGDSVEVPQDHAAVLVGTRREDRDDVRVDVDAAAYNAALKTRAEVLRANLQRAGLSELPPVPSDAAALADNIARLNDAKRAAWLARVPRNLPIDGDVLIEEFQKERKVRTPVKGQPLNFYFTNQ